MALEHFTGKGLSEHFDDAVQAGVEWLESEDGGNVAPTGDGKGCTDRDLPM